MTLLKNVMSVVGPGFTAIPEVRCYPCLETWLFFWFLFFVFFSHSLISSFDYFINYVATLLVNKLTL